MSRITAEMSLQQIADLPGFEEIGFTFMESRPSTQEKMYRFPIAGMGELWGADGLERIMTGFERLDDIVCSGRPYAYDFWDEAERAADPAKARTKLVHFPGDDGAPFVMVVPGGGYNSVCSAIEGYFAAARLGDLGYHAFLVTYRTREAALMPAPIEDLARAIRFVLDHAEELRCAGDYACMGFSAGAHLAGMMATATWGWRHWGLTAPKAEVLCYPVADLRLCTGAGSNPTTDEMLTTMLGTDFDEADLARWSVVDGVDETFPPTYLWQCADDDVILVDNLLAMSRVLTTHGVHHRTAVYPRGGHGLMKPHDELSTRWFEGVAGLLSDVMPTR